MAEEESVLECKRLGCGQRYRESENTKGECHYHWGKPFFHDAYKGWTCCQKKSTDFTTFLNFKGCKTGIHSTIRPEETEEKPRPQEEDKNEEEEAREEVEEEIEEEVAEEFRQIDVSETKALEAWQEKEKKEESVGEEACLRCGKRSRDMKIEEREECVYHSGQTIFHETLKYWTCCPNRKFTDFTDFQSLRGCHVTPKHQMERRVAKPREDWFQTNDVISIVVYGVKGARKAKETRVETNGRVVRAHFADKDGHECWSRVWHLWSEVRYSESRVLLDKTKLEISLQKRKRGQYWNALEERANNNNNN